MSQEEPEFKYITESKTLKLALDELIFDQTNVRLAHLNPKSDEIEELLLKIGDIEELVDQIIATQRVLEPLIVRPNQNDEKYVVIEGNRRLAACRLILKRMAEGKYSHLKTENISKIKCRVLSEDVTDKSLALYIVFLHVKTKKPWQLFNRAKYIHDLNKIYHLSYDDIASYGFMSKSTVERTNKCYNKTLEYHKKFKDDDIWFKKYSYFWQLYSSKTLFEFRQDEKNIEDYMKWIYERKFKMYHNVRDLAKIISNPSAFQIFKNTKELDTERGISFQNAMKIVEKNDPGLTDKKFKIIKNTISLFQNLTRTDIAKINNDPNRIEYIRKLYVELTSFLQENEKYSKPKIEK